jgi:hypothetical protein
VEVPDADARQKFLTCRTCEKPRTDTNCATETRPCHAGANLLAGSTCRAPNHNLVRRCAKWSPRSEAICKSAPLETLPFYSLSIHPWPSPETNQCLSLHLNDHTSLGSTAIRIYSPRPTNNRTSRFGHANQYICKITKMPL